MEYVDIEPRLVRPGRLRSIVCAFVLVSLMLVLADGLTQQSLPPSLEKQVATGVDALKAGDLETAERIFNSALEGGVKHPLIFHNLGVIAQQRGNHKQAILRFGQAIQLRPDYGPSRLLLGVSLRAVGRNRDAVAQLKRAVQLMPKEPQAHLQLAKAYEASENWISAVAQLQKLVDSDPQNPEYQYQLGRAWTRLSGWSYQQIRRLNPDSARLQQALGQEYAIQGKYDLALAAYRKASEADPKLPEIHFAQAVILLELKRFDEALVQVDLEQELVPESKAAAEMRTKIEAAKSSLSP